MQRLPHRELLDSLNLEQKRIDSKIVKTYRKQIIAEFKEQLVAGAPNAQDEKTLKRLTVQLRNKQVTIKLFLRYPLHAKLYLCHRTDSINPITGYLGSSNLTFAGLSGQAELNIDVDSDMAVKLQNWFEKRWNDQYAVDITDDLVEVLEESWARSERISPYHAYLKMAYHLSAEAREGISEFKIPRDFGNTLFEFQLAAVKIAARYLHERNGVLIGDVVGLGKTLMATALARIFEDDLGIETLILCPTNLVTMWEDYAARYRLRAKVMSSGRVLTDLVDLRRYRLVIIDESHNFRNREGKRYKAIRDYVRANDSKCILLSATPYNKTYLDLSGQLRMFLDDEQDLGIRPERFLRDLGEVEFSTKYQVSPRSLAAFDRSEYPEDWRDLMHLYMIRRTRSFIKDNYAATDETSGRKFLRYGNNEKSFFPSRTPKTVTFAIRESDPQDQYAALYSDKIIDAIGSLHLPRYGLGNYVLESQLPYLDSAEARVVDDLSRGGKRLMGFCRTGLFKRLESGGDAFLKSVRRHVFRNYVHLYAIQNGLPIPVGSQNADLLDLQFTDKDIPVEDDEEFEESAPETTLHSEDEFYKLAAKTYNDYATQYRNRFKWIRSKFFTKDLKVHLQEDARSLSKILDSHGNWNPDDDAKLNALYELVEEHSNEGEEEEDKPQKILIFSQFADTVKYIAANLEERGVRNVAHVTGDTDNPSSIVWRFSPISNNKESKNDVRILVATDLLSEGQNLQDCHIVINYDLPWAIIRLIQRVGRVDRIGQKSKKIFCYSFLPAEGVDCIINLRSRVLARLRHNEEVIGTDEQFFEGEDSAKVISDLYNEKAGILDGEHDDGVDLASHAYQIWMNAKSKNPRLASIIPALPNSIFSSKSHKPTSAHPEGVLVFVRRPNGNNGLAYIDQSGKSVTESPFEILEAAKCEPMTEPQQRQDTHHELVIAGVNHLNSSERNAVGQLGSSRGARYKAYTMLQNYAEEIKNSLLAESDFFQSLRDAITDIHNYPLRDTAKDTLNRQIRSGISNEELAKLVIGLREDDKLSIIHEQISDSSPQIICSIGLEKIDAK